MSDTYLTNLPANIYEEKLSKETLCDCASQGLLTIPKLNSSLSVIYLQNNKLSNIPHDFFPSLPNLKYLDLRDNLLTELPKTIKNHEALTHLLLQNNKITTLPHELGTVATLKVLQLNGNPLTFPPKEIINEGVTKVRIFLENAAKSLSKSSRIPENEYYTEENTSSNGIESYNPLENNKNVNMVVQIYEKQAGDTYDDEFYRRLIRQCPKLAKSRHTPLPSYLQSAKYVKAGPNTADSKELHYFKIKQAYLRERALKKHKELLATSEKIIQGRKNLEQLKNWRTNYNSSKSNVDETYRLYEFPYDTHPQYMTLLSREDIEKDLPDKFKKRLSRKSKPSVPRKSNKDVHLAIKIKQLFENLETIDLNKEGMTPRTEQRVLKNEIQKITEIKQKLKELAHTNTRSVITD